MEKFGPCTVNVEALAKGLFDLFTDEEKTILQFGMLPAHAMASLHGELAEIVKPFKGMALLSGRGKPVIYPAHNGEIPIDTRKIVRDISIAVSSEMYKMGELVV